MTVVLLKLKFGWGSFGLLFSPPCCLMGAQAFEEEGVLVVSLHVPMLVLVLEIKHPPMTMLPEGGAA